VRSWALREIDTPGGSRSPVVLHSDDDRRAVLIRLEPGQELGDHQVKESAFLVVVEGEARIESGAETVDAEPGTLVAFEPHERHSVASAGGARILLVLAPWPAHDHYEAEDQVQARG
jgi:quercetin dioxygenase-like cupin family protein